MPNKLIGTAPNQVPVNGMLGELAFQSKENINFTGGTGKLSKLDIEKISSQLSVAANDIVVYDTSKDSDGGAWRNRCQNTSWYNEDLNTSTRGSRREFPSVAVIVVTSNSVIIYDGDDSTLPMWMVFNGSSPSHLLCSTATCCCALNAKIVVGASTNERLRYFDFLVDRTFDFGDVVGLGTRISPNGLAYRNKETASLIYNSTQLIASRYISDVDIIVLPGAPIDPQTLLPVPTIGISHNSGGVSVIRHDGSVTKPISLSMFKVAFDYNFNLHYFGENNQRWDYSPYPAYNANVTSGFYGTYATYEKNACPIKDGIALGPANVEKSKLKLTYKPTESNNKMLCHISSKYNSGWMPSTIVGAWLSDTTSETITSNELVTNGTFNTNVSGWSTTAGSSIVYSAGTATVTCPTSANWSGAYQAISTVVGKKYTIVAKVNSSTGWGSVSVGSNLPPGGSGKIIWLSFNSASTFPLYLVGTFTAAATTSYVSIDNLDTTNGSVINLDDISVRLADEDRSNIGAGLQIIGTISKTPVETGADLVAYSGFSTSNYLYHSPSSAYNFGTSDFCVSMWLKVNKVSGSFSAMQIQYPSSNVVKIGYDGIGWYCQIGTTILNYENTTLIDAPGFIHVALVRNGRTGRFYINGSSVPLMSVTDNGITTNLINNTGLYVGYGFNSSIALVRISTGTVNDEQISKMYNDEKLLFQENAKATLYGSADYVTAVYNDTSNNLLHVGTSSGRSVFQGLRRIDNTTTAVSTAISASNGLVAEQ